MLSNKWTFSLTSLVVLLAFGLVCFAPSAMAGDGPGTKFDIGVTIMQGESMIDIDTTDHAGDDIQIATGRDRASRDIDILAGATENALTITLLVEFDQQVELFGPHLVDDDTVDPEVEVRNSGRYFGADDIFVRAFDIEGRALGQLPLDKVVTEDESIIGFRDATNPGRQFLVRIDEEELVAAYRTALRTPSNAGLEITSLFFFIPQGNPSGDTVAVHDAKLADGRLIEAQVRQGIRRADVEHAVAHFHPDAHQHLNKASNVFRVDLVDEDQGNPQYATITSPSTAQDVALTGLPIRDEPALNRGSGTPGVVSIMRTASRAGFIESGAFDVRIILTEDPNGGLTTANIMVDKGSATSLTKGLTYKGGHPTYTIAARTIEGEEAGDPSVDIAAVEVAQRDSELGPAMVDFYHADGDAEAAATAVTGETADNGTVAGFPEATGRDNMYHSYIATIQPSAGVNGMVTVSIGALEDKVLPISKQYIPLTREQRLATTLTGTAMHVRDARVKNESLTVQVRTGADTTSVKALGLAAYTARQVILDALPNEITLANKLVIPAGGYAVIVVDRAAAAIEDPLGTLKAKVTVAQNLYNVFDPGDDILPFPANDLDNFFRNGGTLTLGYADIAAATGSGTDESKGATGDDATGYTAADSTAYATGAVIINEIMWGLDGNDKTSQYIELHNPGTADVTIDNLEWVISVGSLPTGFAAIDTINNNPATGYWAPPGNGGVTVASVAYPTVSDLVSMSRVTDATDGTAAASWAASMRPSANISGRRVGTPGAANAYVMPAPPEDPPADPVTPAAPAAEADDIMISEIMVASDDGRFPQWIEISNVSAATVSLSGWSLEIENDSADPDVVGESIEIDLGDVEIGADQVALVVSKESTRNSGVGVGDGDLRADRIIDVQSDVSPDTARYNLISEMGFMISLMPPRTGAVRKPGDVVGNLDGGWELPASEGSRSSLIRREMGDAGEIMGTDAAGWVLASDTMLDGAYRTTYYGSDEDVGTPGYNAGGALPVELSKFGAKRDPLTGAVVITWSTQSELNNAGFFIKRSQQTKGKFVVVNPTMIAGAGTTAEKQSYTYTDATADPNVIYYYQIEDVSLDGNRQTLTRAHRLKGHIGAAGKATTTWGELKSSRE